MNETIYTAFFTPEELVLKAQLEARLCELAGESLCEEDMPRIDALLAESVEAGKLRRDSFGLNPIINSLQTAIIVVDEMGMRRAAIVSILLHDVAKSEYISIEEIGKQYGADVAVILNGLVRINKLYEKNPTIESENFRNLLLSFAEDMRVILIMIADRVNIMRQIKDAPNEAARLQVANEAAYLYAPLAHKLGLYKLKSELEDLSLKYTQHDMYYHIKEKLNATKAARDKYIAAFIDPIDKKLAAAGLKYHIKGRTKSIHSISQKMKKQKTTFEGIYDLFAIRIILDSEYEKEKQECWAAYSIVTDMYQPNPKRLRDWLSIPKSNGYESLHTTVMGPEGKWVEVQIRTERMDEIAERGLAAHWRYKGVKSETGLDEWLTSIREALEHTDDSGMELMDQFKMELYKDDVFVFTPKGDLFKLPHGATVLDFAFHIHTNVGARCTGAKVNGKHAQLRQVLSNGDQVEILTSSTQTPKQGWLDIVTTSKARNKIRQSLNEIESRQAAFARETIERKFKNRKIEYDEPTMMRLIRNMGYKQVKEFYQKIAEGSLDVNQFIDRYVQAIEQVTEPQTVALRSAEGYTLQQSDDYKQHFAGDVLVIDQNLKGVDFKLAQCCNPIYGDEVFGFVTTGGGIKIHRCDCPNAPDMQARFGYRVVKARWAGKSKGALYPITLTVIGHDDIGIVNNITSIISKEENIQLRNISINSHDGLFSGTLTVMIEENARLQALIKKLRTVKGVKQVNRN
ncbi:MAG: bifunctional (p)ppGpp synthetase/guanosine-3',5'-bis(diphosphate) 3'-pyrophosphohydrolase [Bacteroidaceae bacterium]|nr:bifunctional (p)ppGpp synthetase/guanosine-3',5'-bis(diphosphate) 3'-pyrophosphohydrolase [Bacteroidaceae bacterium]